MTAGRSILHGFTYLNFGREKHPSARNIYVGVNFEGGIVGYFLSLRSPLLFLPLLVWAFWACSASRSAFLLALSPFFCCFSWSSRSVFEILSLKRIPSPWAILWERMISASSGFKNLHSSAIYCLFSQARIPIAACWGSILLFLLPLC